MKTPEYVPNFSKVKWLDIEDAQSSVEKFLRDFNISTPEMEAKTDDELARILEKYLVEEGRYPDRADKVSVTISNGVSHGHRKIKGMFISPLTGEVINFEV